MPVESEQDMDGDLGVPPSGSGCQPAASAADAASRSGIPNANERLAELLALEENWDSYRGRAIDRACAERVRAFYPLAERLGLQPWICPLSDGGLQVERAGIDDWSVEFAPDGTTAVYFDRLSDKDALGLVAMFAQLKALDQAAIAIETQRAETENTGSVAKR